MAQLLGKWVPARDVPEWANVSGRRWMTEDGELTGTYYGPDSMPPGAHDKGLLWYYPSQREITEDRERVRALFEEPLEPEDAVVVQSPWWRRLLK